MGQLAFQFLGLGAGQAGGGLLGFILQADGRPFYRDLRGKALTAQVQPGYFGKDGVSSRR